MNDVINPWEVKAVKTVYDNNWIQVSEYDVINAAGNPGIYGKVHFKSIAIGIVPMDEENNIWLVGQYRFPLQQYSWEIPEGGCPEGTDPLASAKRELLEETGLIAQEWHYLQTAYLSNSVTDELANIYLAKKLSQQQAMPEDTEQLQLKKVSFAQAIAMIQNGEITDAITIIALLKLKLMLL